jgi:ribosomal protein S12 methylthiotransferase accessory factor
MRALVGDVGRFRGRENAIAAGGVALDGESAVIKAIGEAVERFCSEAFDFEAVSYHSFRDVREHAVDPRRFILFAEWQLANPRFGIQHYDHSMRIAWSKGYSLTEGRDILVPALMSHIGYTPGPASTGRARRESLWEVSPVSGYAAANTIEEAAIGALCEVIERDALMYLWRRRVAVPEIDLSSIEDPDSREHLNRWEGLSVEVRCFDATTDVGVPVVLGVMIARTPRRPWLSVGLGCDPAPDRALRKALLELGSTNVLVRTLAAQALQSGKSLIPDSVETQEAHSLLYSTPVMAPHMDFVLRPRPKTSLAALPRLRAETAGDTLRAVIDRLAAVDLESLIVDLTVPAAKELGLYVVRALVPGALPLDFGTKLHHLGADRLGVASRDEALRLNLIPHPLP